MATGAGNPATASDFNSIRNRVIAEFNASSRRNIGSNYKSPAGTQSGGNYMYASNVDNIAKDLYYVNSSTYPSNGISSGTLINMIYIDSALASYAGYAKQGNNSGCKSGCIGLCQGCTGGCSSSCTSCTGCSGGCASCTSCSGSCDGGCTGCTSCSGGCTSCSGSCSGGCGGSCSDACTGCTGCSGGCTSCSGSCSGGCTRGSF